MKFVRFRRTFFANSVCKRMFPYPNWPQNRHLLEGTSALCFNLCLRRCAFFKSFAICARAARACLCASSKSSISLDTPDDGLPADPDASARRTEDAVLLGCGSDVAPLAEDATSDELPAMLL